MRCRNCGATLAESAQYCMQCGTPAGGSPQGIKAPLPTVSFVGPSFLAGTLMGILSSIPLVNCLCCAWLLGGGGLSAWLVGRNTSAGPQALSYGDGAFAGVLTGVWGAVVATLASIPLRLLSAGALQEQQAQLETLLNEYPEIAGPARDTLMSLAAGDISPLTVLITLVSNLLIYGLFAMLGGILLVAIIRRRPGSGVGTSQE